MVFVANFHILQIIFSLHYTFAFEDGGVASRTRSKVNEAMDQNKDENSAGAGKSGDYESLFQHLS